MSEAIIKHKEEKIVAEYNQLIAFKRLANSADGKMFINFILEESQLDYDAYEISKNRGNTANNLGRQGVGRAIVDKLIQAGVQIDCTIFSKKKNDRIEELKIKMQNI